MKIKILLLANIIAISMTAKSVPLPQEIPFKRSLTMVSILLFSAPLDNASDVKELAEKLVEYAQLEAAAKQAVAPMRDARTNYKQCARKTVFKDINDLNAVLQHIAKNTDTLTANSIRELHRDNLIQFNAAAQPILNSDHYHTQLFPAAHGYYSTQRALHAHPLFDQIQIVRSQLKPLMHSFLHKRYSNVNRLHTDFNESIMKVHEYLDGLAAAQK